MPDAIDGLDDGGLVHRVGHHEALADLAAFSRSRLPVRRCHSAMVLSSAAIASASAISRARSSVSTRAMSFFTALIGRGVVELAGGELEAQVEQRFLVVGQLARGDRCRRGRRAPLPSPSEALLTAHEAGLDRQLLDGAVDGLDERPPRRGRTARTGSDRASRRRPSRSGLPLPEPMRVSAGFSVTGLSGKTLIHTLPPRLMWRVMAIRAASI